MDEQTNQDQQEVIRLEPVLNNFIEEYFDGLMFCCPARVEGVQFVDQLRLDVRPLHKPRNYDNTTYEMPVIKNVPFIVTATEDGGMIFSPKQGHTVLLVFPHCDIDAFKGGSVAPYESLSNRKLNVNDAIAINGFLPFNLSVNHPERHFTVHSVDDVSVFNNLGKSNENKLILKSDGSIELRSPKLILFTSDTSRFTGDVFVDKNMDVSGNLHVAEVLTVDDDIIAKKDIVIRGKSLWTYMNSHSHKYTDDGNLMDTLSVNPF